MTTRLIIDCDPGHDDAMAILFAARHLDLVGITTVFGNTSLANTTRNALGICALGGLDVPVAAGMSAPLVAQRAGAADIHGKSGLDGAVLPAPTREPVAKHAVQFIIDTARAAKGELMLAPIGPLTNIAVALKIGVGNGDRRPLPPNPVCGFPATGSPVSCFHIGIGAPIDGLRTS